MLTPNSCEETVRRTRQYHLGWSRLAIDLMVVAIDSLETAMQQEPGPYPDPDVPISKWQTAHEHLLAARELLKP